MNFEIMDAIICVKNKFANSQSLIMWALSIIVNINSQNPYNYTEIREIRILLNDNYMLCTQLSTTNTRQ